MFWPRPRGALVSFIAVNGCLQNKTSEDVTIGFHQHFSLTPLSPSSLFCRLFPCHDDSFTVQIQFLCVPFFISFVTSLALFFLCFPSLSPHLACFLPLSISSIPSLPSLLFPSPSSFPFLPVLSDESVQLASVCVFSQ